jgi:hypothetical protein
MEDLLEKLGKLTLVEAAELKGNGIKAYRQQPLWHRSYVRGPAAAALMRKI